MPGGGTDDMEVVRQLGNRALLTLLNLLYGAASRVCATACWPSGATNSNDLNWARTASRSRLRSSYKRSSAGWILERCRARGSPPLGESNLNTWRDGLRVLRTLVGTRLTRGLGSFAGLAPAIWARLTAGGGRRERRRARPVAPSQRHERGLAALFRGRRTVEPTAVGSISVVLCTYSDSRWAHLVDALDSLRRQPLRTFYALEVIVVVDRDRLCSPECGASCPTSSRSRVLRRRGSLIGGAQLGRRRRKRRHHRLLDDDAVAAPDWLERLTSSYADPAVIGVSGSIRPAWAAERPRWLPRETRLGCRLQLPRAAIDQGGSAQPYRREYVVPPRGIPGRRSLPEPDREDQQATDGLRGNRALDTRAAAVSKRTGSVRPGCGRRSPGSPRARAVALPALALLRQRDSRRRSCPRMPERQWAGIRARLRGADAPSRVCARNASRISRTRDRTGIARAAAIVIALGLTAAGYGVGRLQLAIPCTMKSGQLGLR